MPRRLFNVSDSFHLRGRGLVVVADETYETLDPSITLKVGDSLSIRHVASTPFTVTVLGIEHCDPWSPKQELAFLLNGDLTRELVPHGAEVWSVDD
jgi:hypothetical protein